jgi:hypothetical protein
MLNIIQFGTLVQPLLPLTGAARISSFPFASKACAAAEPGQA